jgi:hypothetical protein
MRLPKNNSSKHTNQMQLYTEHILTNYINLNKKIKKNENFTLAIPQLCIGQRRGNC